jgi:hypothetical protein
MGDRKGIEPVLSVMAILRQLISSYDLARDATQNSSLFPHRNRDSGVCSCTTDFYSEILSVGTVLSAASSGSRKESVVGSRRNRAEYSVGGVHVAHSRSRNRSQWSDTASMSVIAIFPQLTNRRLIQLSGIESPAENAVIARP